MTWMKSPMNRSTKSFHAPGSSAKQRTRRLRSISVRATATPDSGVAANNTEVLTNCRRKTGYDASAEKGEQISPQSELHFIPDCGFEAIRFPADAVLSADPSKNIDETRFATNLIWPDDSTQHPDSLKRPSGVRVPPQWNGRFSLKHDCSVT